LRFSTRSFEIRADQCAQRAIPLTIPTATKVLMADTKQVAGVQRFTFNGTPVPEPAAIA